MPLTNLFCQWPFAERRGETNESCLSAIVIVGTVHLGRADAPLFAENLHRLLLAIAPNVILAELTPDQAEGRATIKSKPEYESAVFPAAKKLGARIIPIQPGQGRGAEFEKEQIEAITTITGDPQRAAAWRQWEQFAQGVGEGLVAEVSVADGMEPVRSFAADRYLFEPWQAAMKTQFPEYQDCWERFNQLLLEQILAAYHEHEGKRFAVTVGMAHRAWLRQHLGDAGIPVVSPAEAGG